MKDDQGNNPKTFPPDNYSSKNLKDSNKVNIGSSKIQGPPSERIIIRISDTIPQPPTEPKIRSLDTAIKAATGQAVKSGSSEKMAQEAARDLWRRGVNPDKLESAVRGSSATLNERDMKNLLDISGELRKLNKAYPNTTKEFLSLSSPKDALEIKNLSERELKRNENAVLLEKTELGLQAEKNENEYYSPDYINESQNYLEDMEDYAEDVSQQPEEVEYEEPEISPPQIRTQTTSTQPSEPTGGGVRDVLNRGRSTVTDAGKKLVSNATNAAKTATKKVVKQGLSNLATSAGPALAQAGLYIGAAVAIIMGLLTWLAIVIVTVVLWTIGFIIFVAVILIIINSGAYMVPPGEDLTQYGAPGVIPPGGVVGSCSNFENPVDITNELAGRIQNGNVRLLPLDSGARPLNYCFTPLMVILHTSAGYDNDEGNDRVYEVLAPPERQASCNMASDTNDVILMQPFYETVAEMSWCSNSWNDMGVSIEISGECQDGTSPCRRSYSKCQVGTDSYPYIFSPPGGSPTHPCPDENDLTFSAVCEVMKQYNLPWCQIFTHDDVPNQSHTDPVGKAWVNNYFIPRLRDNCQVPANSQCR